MLQLRPLQATHEFQQPNMSMQTQALRPSSHPITAAGWRWVETGAHPKRTWLARPLP
jgi:hypothetical protein